MAAGDVFVWGACGAGRTGWWKACGIIVGCCWYCCCCWRCICWFVEVGMPFGARVAGGMLSDCRSCSTADVGLEAALLRIGLSRDGTPSVANADSRSATPDMPVVLFAAVCWLLPDVWLLPAAAPCWFASHFDPLWLDIACFLDYVMNEE